MMSETQKRASEERTPAGGLLRMPHAARNMHACTRDQFLCPSSAVSTVVIPIFLPLRRAIAAAQQRGVRAWTPTRCGA
jgi:hypothetical protein